MQPRLSFRILVSLKVFEGEEIHGTPLKQTNFMLPSPIQAPISELLQSIDAYYRKSHHNEPNIRSTKLFVEDHYEVDHRYSVGECLGDFMKVFVAAKVSGKKQKSKGKLSSDKLAG